MSLVVEQRVFSYSTATDKALLGISLVAALGSGVAVAMLNLVMGDFLTVMGDFSRGGFEISNSLTLFPNTRELPNPASSLDGIDADANYQHV